MNLSDSVQLALIAVGLAIVTGLMSLVTAAVNNRNIRTMKKEDAEAVKQEKIRMEAREDLLAQRLRDTAEAARLEAAHARVVLESVEKKVDGLLVDRDKAKKKEGAEEEKLISDDRAKTLAEGQRQGREEMRATLPVATDTPLPVTDDRTAKAAEDGATAAAASAEALKRIADK